MSVFDESGIGGSVLAGVGETSGVFSPIASGGLVVCQPMFSNGFQWKTTITVPANTVASDMQFHLGVRLELPNVLGSVRVEDVLGNALSSEIRQVDELQNQLVVFFDCFLRKNSHNIFYIYSGGA
ncbi:MAG: hypothetical protein H6824_01260 [Planctomycetaceae bacterium]|nr:hypothetical protein [Planctomycetaceae bacterium]